MMTIARSWVKENATLVYFLIGQAIALVSLGAYGLSYMVKLETRVSTLEVRGSPHLNDINNRLTVLESTTKDNKRSIDRIVDVMTKELHVQPTRDR
jgi:hypothetical protein